MQSWPEGILEAARALPPELAVMGVATLPVLELRGAIPLGIAMGLSPAHTLLLAFLGNLIPAPVLLLILDPLVRWFYRQPFCRRWAEWLYNRSRRREEQVRRYGWVGLMLLVAIPLPTTGVWTASLVAAVLRLEFRLAISAIIAGAAVAGILVTVLSVLGYTLFIPR